MAISCWPRLAVDRREVTHAHDLLQDLDLVSGWGCCQWEALCLFWLLHLCWDQEAGGAEAHAVHFWVEKLQESKYRAGALPHGHLW